MTPCFTTDLMFYRLSLIILWFKCLPLKQQWRCHHLSWQFDSSLANLTVICCLSVQMLQTSHEVGCTHLDMPPRLNLCHSFSVLQTLHLSCLFIVLLNHILFMVLYNFWIQGSGTTEGLLISHPVFILLTGWYLITVVLYFSSNLSFFSPFLQFIKLILNPFLVLWLPHSPSYLGSICSW